MAAHNIRSQAREGKVRRQSATSDKARGQTPLGGVSSANVPEGYEMGEDALTTDGVTSGDADADEDEEEVCLVCLPFEPCCGQVIAL